MSLATSPTLASAPTRRHSITSTHRRAVRDAVAAFLGADDVDTRLDARDALMDAILAPGTTLDVPPSDGQGNIDATHVRSAEVDGVVYSVIFDGYNGAWHLVVMRPEDRFKV
jgi:hypothetical protein